MRTVYSLQHLTEGKPVSTLNIPVIGVLHSITVLVGHSFKLLERSGSRMTQNNIPCQRWVSKSLMVMVVCAVSSPLMAQDTSLSRYLLIQMSRDQSSVLCGSKKFTQCMVFSEAQCLELSEKAIKKCLEPLPERIDPAQLQNEAIEACPRRVYDDAGFTDEKAKMCLEKAMEQ